MSTSAASPLPARTATTATAVKSQRVLACALCQQRKVKCDRKFPCANCVRAGTQCVPTSAPRPRRRRFPERELLDRIRHYEGLLCKNSIIFEPLHTHTHVSPVTTEHAFPSEDGGDVDSVDDTYFEMPREKSPMDSKAP